MEHGESLPEPKGVQPRPDLWPAHSHSGIMASSFFWSSLFSLRGERGPCRHSTPGTEAAGATAPALSLDSLMNLSCPWSCSVALQAPKGAAQPRTLHRSCAGNTAPHGAGAAPGTAGDPQGQQELEDKENRGMLGSHSPQHLRAWPDTEQPPVDTELTRTLRQHFVPRAQTPRAP